MRRRPWINSKSAYKRFLREELAMKTLYEDDTLALFYHKGAYSPPTFHKAIGLQRMSMLHEAWVYNTIEQTFYAEKNKSITSELVKLMAKSGIKLKSTAARLSDASAMQVKFATERDYFLFKLKYGL